MEVSIGRNDCERKPDQMIFLELSCSVKKDYNDIFILCKAQVACGYMEEETPRIPSMRCLSECK